MMKQLCAAYNIRIGYTDYKCMAARTCNMRACLCMCVCVSMWLMRNEIECFKYRPIAKNENELEEKPVKRIPQCVYIILCILHSHWVLFSIWSVSPSPLASISRHMRVYARAYMTVLILFQPILYVCVHSEACREQENLCIGPSLLPYCITNTHKWKCRKRERERRTYRSFNQIHWQITELSMCALLSSNGYLFVQTLYLATYYYVVINRSIVDKIIDETCTLTFGVRCHFGRVQFSAKPESRTPWMRQ